MIVQKYLSDLGSSFTSSEFAHHLRQFDQTIRFAGTSAHHQNPIAEKAIQDIMSIAHTLLLHAAIHWPEVADAQLWPMAVDHATFLHNHMPREDTGLSPHDLFTRIRWPHAKFHDLHVWGCPVYVLDKHIADGHKLPRWKPRSTRQIFVGFSNQHASSVPLVLNPLTGAITAQYHVVFDDWFNTVSSTPESLPNFNSPEWSALFGDSVYQYPLDDDPLGDVTADIPTYDPSLSMDTYDWSDSPYQTTTTPSTAPSTGPPPSVPSPSPTPVTSFSLSSRGPSHSSVPFVSKPSVERASPVERAPVLSCSSPIGPSLSTQTSVTPLKPSSERASTAVPSASSSSSSTLQRELGRLASHNTPGAQETNSLPRTRTRQAPKKYGYTAAIDFDTLPDNFTFLAHPVWNEQTNTFEPTSETDTANPFANGFILTPDSACYSLFSQQAQGSTGPVGYYTVPSSYLGYKPTEAPRVYLHRVDGSMSNKPTDLEFFKATVSDPDTLTWDEAMAEGPENVAKWLEAADKEIKALEGKEAWNERALSDATVKVIPGTWVFRRKRSPAGEITKWKARWVLRGDLQEVNFDTYAAVVAWSTVRIFLVMSLLLGWTTKALDFDNAFIQAKLDHECWAYLPRGYYSMMSLRHGDKACLRLNKSVYGLKVAPKLWFEHLKRGLVELGFKSSSYDECLLYHKGMLLVVFVDDCGLAVSDPSMIDWFVNELRKRGFELQVEGDFTAFLGVALDRLPDGSIHLHQSGLIKKIIVAAKMEDANPNWLPATATLGSDPDGEPYTQHPWKYSTIVGMLIYLATNTRPDISFATSQVARYSKSPRQSHATAVKTIIRYLKRTSDKGTIITFSGALDMIDYVDADFAGLFGKEPPRNPDSARSRAGFVILLGGMPLFWKSALMTAICLSTLEAEYQALSLSMKYVIAYKLLIDELVEVLKLDDLKTTISTKVYEDNQGALYLATNQRLTNRTKYFHVKWHHFWWYVQTEQLSVEKVDTKFQAADYLTKHLPRALFENCRKIVQGW